MPIVFQVPGEEDDPPLHDSAVLQADHGVHRADGKLHHVGPHDGAGGGVHMDHAAVHLVVDDVQ